MPPHTQTHTQKHTLPPHERQQLCLATHANPPPAGMFTVNMYLLIGLFIRLFLVPRVGFIFAPDAHKQQPAADSNANQVHWRVLPWTRHTRVGKQT